MRKEKIDDKAPLVVIDNKELKGNIAKIRDDISEDIGVPKEKVAQYINELMVNAYDEIENFKLGIDKLILKSIKNIVENADEIKSLLSNDILLNVLSNGIIHLAHTSTKIFKILKIENTWEVILDETLKKIRELLYNESK